MSAMDLTTIASNSFKVTLEGSFRTAAFGGEALTNTNTFENTFEAPGLA